VKHADHWFYVPDSSSTEVSFPVEEALHAVRVLRLQVGDGIQWINGKGGRFIGTITRIDKRSLTASVKEYSDEPKLAATVLAVGQLHDAGRMEWLAEKATELGVSEILLLSTERVERTRYKMSRLVSKVISAVKQSGRAWVPGIREVSYTQALDLANDYDTCLLAHCYSELDRNKEWKSVPVGQSACLFIGPEGDFTLAEVERASQLGIESIALGSARLRTETAALAALVRLRDLGV
jgi:16S rRNA (uracil1498-N3)-methyltransferase